MTRNWRAAAACRTVDPELFFPTAEAGPVYEAQVAEAKAVCARCPVRAACLTEALRRIPDGICGGLTPTERRARTARTDRPASAMIPQTLADAERLGKAGRRRVGLHLLDNGSPVSAVCKTLGVDDRTVRRWAEILREARRDAENPVEQPEPATAAS